MGPADGGKRHLVLYRAAALARLRGSPSDLPAATISSLVPYPAATTCLR
jgi:hypothetical protein